MAYWENWRNHPILLSFLFSLLNALDKGMGKWTKYASQKSEFYPWLCGDYLCDSVQINWLLWVSISSSWKSLRRVLFTLVALKYSGRTSAFTWKRLPGKEKSAWVGEERFLQNQTQVTFLLTKRIFMQKAFQMSLKQSRNESEMLNVCFFSIF